MRKTGFFDLDPASHATALVRRIAALRDDTLKPHFAGVLEDNRPVTFMRLEPVRLASSISKMPLRFASDTPRQWPALCSAHCQSTCRDLANRVINNLASAGSGNGYFYLS
jgi:hypothetical protein